MEHIVIAAHKGGSGKTTVAVNLAGALATIGQRVVVVDVDPQGAAAAALGVVPQKPTLYEALMGQVAPGEPIVATSVEGLYLLPSDLDLAGAELELPRHAKWQQALTELLSSLDNACDIAILDTPPGLGVLSYMALSAASGAIVVCPLEFLAFRALTHLREMTQRAGTRLLGIVPTFMTTTTRHAREVDELLHEEYSELLLPPIPRRVALQDAALAGEPIIKYQPSSDAAPAFIQLSQEVLSRATPQPA